MKSNLLSDQFQKQTLKLQKQAYEELIEDITLELKEGYSTPYLSKTFLDELKIFFLQEKLLKIYSPLNFFWSKMMEDLAYIIELHEEFAKTKNAAEKNEIEEELFHYWTQSSFAEAFVTAHNEHKGTIKASKELLPILENNIISFYYVQIKTASHKENALHYQMIPEIGDSAKNIFLGNTNRPAKIDFTSDTGILIIFEINTNENEIIVEEDGKLELHFIGNPSETISDKYPVKVLYSCSEGYKRNQEFKDKILRALKIYQEVAPHLLQTFLNFTSIIIPVNQPGIVSYSLQQIPGYSSINMFERDFLDLLDDLSHENGHHYLNTILNYSELLDEDDDKIYFSPWRRALRPVRGIYHAVFTFYWAFDLFNSLAQAQHADLKEYRERILLRACEEHFMLLYCRPYIDHAFKNKKITKEGMELINTVFALLSQESKNVELMIEVLKKQYSKSFSKISELKLTLNEKAKHYKL
jgi:hypothetical protein